MTPAEKLANEKEVSRKIHAEINNFGISDHQRLFLIYLLALELEDLESRHDISVVAKTRLEELKMLISSPIEESDD